jgi:outer membrane protein, multidrug efflux system
MMRRTVVLLSAALAGCVRGDLTPRFVPPVMPPAAWRTPPATTGTIEEQWWKGFGDPALDALIDRALANNSDIGIAIGRVREARGNLRAAAAQLSPTLDASGAASRSRSVSPFLTPSEANAAQPQVAMAYEVDLFGRLADEKSAARDAYFASTAGRDAVRLSIAGTVATAYISLCGLDAQLEIARATLTAREEALRLARSRVARGYSPRLELDQAEAEYQAARQIVPGIELSIATTENSLSELVGETPQSIGRGVGFEKLVDVSIPADLPSELLRRRPDIAVAEAQLAASDMQLAASRKAFLPRLTLTASGGEAISTLLANPITLWSVGGSILAPLFEGGRLRGQAEAAAGRRDQAAYAYRKSVLVALREVDDALVSVKRLDEQGMAANEQTKALREALRRATNRYREGYSPYLEQLDAQRQLLSAQLGLIQGRTGALIARVQLFMALGGGWTSDTPFAATGARTAPQ